MREAINKRILIAKEFYLNGVELARSEDPLSKMIAIHNFHISIEITIKSILLQYEIRNEKTLNIDFESMLNEVDKHQEFQSKGLRLPYRQEMRNLNQYRNLVQHHALEPDKSSMEDWLLFSNRFLKRAFKDYFDIDFDKVNRTSFISDDLLKEYLEVSLDCISASDYESAACLSAAAFTYASSSVLNFIPKSEDQSFSGFSLREREFQEISLAMQSTHERIDEVEHFTAMLASGVNLSEYKKYIDSSPRVIIVVGGSPRFVTRFRQEFSQESCEWLINFVISSIIVWQNLGFSPRVDQRITEGAKKFIEDFSKESDQQTSNNS